MSELTLAEIVELTGGQAHGISDFNLKPTTAVYDSREVEAGSLFAAFEGEHHDGHDFVESAIQAGALAALVSKPVSARCIVVSDVQKALTILAAENRKKLTCPVFAITGSSGKTTTKDLLIDLLNPLGKVVATKGSRNNELGMPCTLFAADTNTAAVILEMGARHSGNIRALCEVAKPNIVGITHIGSAHLGEFGSREAIMHTKGEIVELLPANGVAVLNADQTESKEIAKKTKSNIWYFGVSSSADIQVLDLELDNLGHPKFKLKTPLGMISVKLNLVGKHQAYNAAIASGMAIYAGLPLAKIESQLNDANPRSALRMAINDVHGVTIIDDTYNANPESMQAALDALMAMKSQGRRIAVLGEMAELGDESHSLHRQVGLAASAVDILVGIGPLGEEIVAGASRTDLVSPTCNAFTTKEEAIEYLRHEIKNGDIVLFKASRAAGFDAVAAQMRLELSNQGRR